MAQELERAGCAALAMPCNTAHHYAGAIQDSVDIPLLNMVQKTSAALSRIGTPRVGMFASPALRRVGVYEEAFAKQGLCSVFPADDEATLNLICAIKAGKKPDRIAMKSVLDELKSADSDVILVACSELSLYSDSLPTELPCIDNLDVLCGCIVDFGVN